MMMSDGLKIPAMLSMSAGGLLSGAGRAGPRRLVLIGASLVALVALIVIVTTGGERTVIASRDAHMANVDALPGGLHSTPEMNSLAHKADDDQATQALQTGKSYTPELAASVPVFPAPVGDESSATQPASPPRPRFVPHPQVANPMRVVLPTEIPAQPDIVSPPSHIIPVQATIDPNAVEYYNKQIDNLFSQWGGRFPHTDVVTPPPESADASAGDVTSTRRAPATRDAASVTPASLRSDATASRILIPAGRGVYAHPILALSSDQASPAVFQADSGPIAGDRMIGSFSRQGDRLIIHVSTIIHHGEEVSANGVVIAPDTMEASVASDVDQHYLTRFILPAAAAFVQGLGQALATTSNTTSVLSPLGGATTLTQLNFHQQLGVAAGVAAGQIGSVLNQAAPKSATVSLEANTSVGVMFLSDVVSHRS
jgi:intracellular multiplication protein IcmE